MAQAATPAHQRSDARRPRPPANVYRWEQRLVRRALQMVGNPPVTVRFWDGQQVQSGENSKIQITVHDRRALWRLLMDPLFQFGEVYSAGRLEVDGDLVDFLKSLDVAGKPGRAGRSLRQRLLDWWHKPKGTSLRQAKDNIHRHYDIGNDFYKLWLDERLLYTCAYFPTPQTGLEEAQLAKMDHVCRKLRLEPGEEVIEAGCGWGALGLHMAKHYGVSVRAYNISHEQIVYARRQAEEIGIEDHVEYVEDDWRNISGRCDKFVSVGMLEHVGRVNYRRLGDVIHRTLRPHGLGLIHSIGVNWPRPFDAWIERRIFPGAYPPSLVEMVDIFETRDLSVLDVENIRLHYAQTLRHWLQRYEDSLDVVRSTFDERFARAWRLYLAGSAAAFEAGRLQLFQVLFAPGQSNAVPRTRGYQYENGPTRDDELFETPNN